MEKHGSRHHAHPHPHGDTPQQHHHGHEGHHDHDHERDLGHDPRHGGAAHANRDRLAVRLQHQVRHNREHGDFYLNLATEARRMQLAEVEREIHAAADCTARQNEHLERALSLLRRQ